MTDFTIRTASSEDIPELLKFEQGVVEAERPVAMNLRDGHVVYYNLNELIDSPLSEIFVMEDEGKLVACGYIRIEESKPHNKSDRHGYLGFMYVLPSYRGCGLNKLVLDTLLEWGSEQGISTYELEVYAENKPAIRAYEKAGFQRNLIQMVLETK